ncbi:hypothetical protein F2P44_33590, partial [Massilia sp. CCM 8695]|nr:hypothetical protein [Massilia frigida]
MSDVSQVVAQMIDHDMPGLPVGHPILDARYHRFGKGKKAWYILRETTLRSGRTVVTGAFGFFVGENRNTVPVKVDTEVMTDEERADYSRRQRAAEKAEQDKRDQAARLAANRARDAWSRAEHVPLEHPYLARKQIVADGVRVSSDGRLLIPMVRAGQLVGMQKIDQDGEKRYSKGMDKLGAFHWLGQHPDADADLIACGEGYATCCAARMSVSAIVDLPVAVAFDAGGIMAVALSLRQEHPRSHLLFLADDDYQLTERFSERLREEFNVSVPIEIDGQSHLVLADDGADVTVTAWWRTDPEGIRYIETDMRRGRVVRTYQYRNAGVASCHAAARAVGNASVITPLFKDRSGRKLTDFNDLQVEEGLDVVAAQIALSILAAQRPVIESPAPSAAPAAPDVVEPPSEFDAGAAVPPPPGAKQPPEGEESLTQFDARFDAAVIDGAQLRTGVPLAPGEGGDEQEAHKKDKPKKVYGQQHWDQVDDILENFILIYGEDLVWDCRERLLMKLSAMRTIVQNCDVMKFWGGDARKWILKKNIVFDPRERPSPAPSGPTATVNLF